MLLYISESILDKTVKIKLLSAEIEQKLFFYKTELATVCTSRHRSNLKNYVGNI